jgi:hypothetical protein
MGKTSAGLEYLVGDHAPACLTAAGSRRKCPGRTRTGWTTGCVSVRQSSHSGVGRRRRRARTFSGTVMQRNNRRCVQTLMVASEELNAVRRQHAVFFLSFAERWETDANVGGPGRQAAYAALEQEQDNLRGGPALVAGEQPQRRTPLAPNEA